MRPARILLAGVLGVAAVLVQSAVVAGLHLPYGRPDLVVVVVVAIALAGGATAGMSTGFAAGLLADLLSDHPAGLLALVLCLLGFGCGLLQGKLLPRQRHRSSPGLLLGLVVVAAAGAAAMLGHAGLLAIGESPRLDWRVVAGLLPGSAAYDVLVALVVVPAVAAMFRRLRI